MVICNVYQQKIYIIGGYQKRKRTLKTFKYKEIPNMKSKKLQMDTKYSNNKILFHFILYKILKIQKWLHNPLYPMYES